jgi:hypothetical protein
MDKLKAKHFVFILDPEDTQKKMAVGLQSAADDAQKRLYPLFYKAVKYIYGFPMGAERLFKLLISEKQSKPLLSENDVCAYFETLVHEFDLCALKFSNTWISFAAFIDSDRFSSEELVRKSMVFQDSARKLVEVAGGKETRLAGKKYGTSEYLVFGTLCFVFTGPEACTNRSEAVARINMKGTGVAGFFFKGFKSIWGSSSHYQGSVFFDKVQYCLFTNEISSSAALRSPLHFGFSTGDIKSEAP